MAFTSPPYTFAHTGSTSYNSWELIRGALGWDDEPPPPPPPYPKEVKNNAVTSTINNEDNFKTIKLAFMLPLSFL
jgi:hypothetical protein